jgi:tetratricopeptide (TPR) repeat protein
MQCLSMADPAGALAIVEQVLPARGERAPYLAVGSLAALRIGEPAKAVPMLRELIEINPADQPSRNNLAAALLQSGDPDGALEIAGGSPVPSLARIEGFIHQERGDMESAAAAYYRAIAGEPADLASLNNLGNVLASMQEFDAAVSVLERAITLTPTDIRIYLNLAEVLRLADRPRPRLKVLKDAQAIAPDDARVLTDLGMAYTHADDFDNALTILRRAVDLSEGFGEAHIEYGMVLEKLNRVDELAALVAALDRDDATPEAAFLRAWAARRAGKFEEAARLADAIPETVLPMRRWDLVGGIADRLEDTDKAFAAFERMNQAAIAEARPGRGPTYRDTVERDLAAWTPQWAAGWSSPCVTQDGRRDPIFLVGFPRSGTTLLDTMLMGLDELSVLEERPMIARLVKLTEQDDIARYDAARIGELRDAYFATALEEGWDSSRWLVDKHPLNMQRVPLIKRLFPQARLILAERHPYDVVLSCFMANFTLNFAMRSFTGLEEAARTYDAVWRAWHRAIELFPVDWRAVRYERLVVDPRTELEPIVSWLGLQWNDRLLDHTTTARERGRVRTASYAQIGESLYTRASYRWRRYASQLEPVLPILEPWAERMAYPPQA